MYYINIQMEKKRWYSTSYADVCGYTYILQMWQWLEDYKMSLHPECPNYSYVSSIILEYKACSK